MLLGYRTRLYMEIVQRNLLKHIDIILFGEEKIIMHVEVAIAYKTTLLILVLI